ncbi:MAG: CoA activase [Verrucomicrobia bacterium]|nr:CoA activase [Verrucomicrobiota bacterium]
MSEDSPNSDGSSPFRFIGLDAGAETLKLVELHQTPQGFKVVRRRVIEHGKRPGPVLVEELKSWDWPSVKGAAVSGRFAQQFRLPQVPVKQAQLRGFRFNRGDCPATIISIGSHGFSVLELRENGLIMFRENSRCSQGTGNFLRQLIERFSLTVEEASRLCADVANPAPLSGRCPVILKTDMTHLANKGEDRARILAGLFDAVCENVLVLVKPGVSPADVLLIGGVSRAPRVRRVFGDSLARNGMNLLTLEGDEALCLEALGSALVATESSTPLASLDQLLLPPREMKLEPLAGLGESLSSVRRMAARPWACVTGDTQRVILGFDIGSTGSKVVAMDADSSETLWEAYRQTLGDPVGAAQGLMHSYVAGPVGHKHPIAFGVTGSGREIAGSLLTSCYGKNTVFVLNEIVAHATGALHFDPRVDTIFEIGGQDAKYIRLNAGRIVDCAMNEACSAGTGSFIEEQGRKFAGMSEVRELGRAGVEAARGVSLGQHCSVFMAEVIDEAVGAGIEQSAIISGLYDSIIKNYLNRVKGNRSVGQVIFCQGMPFAADALAAAVARQTGSEVIIPPNPGTVGALGIALLAARELPLAKLAPLTPERFLGASVEAKTTFVCGASRGCGGAGNKCRIDNLCTVVAGERQRFTWGGGCSLHDQGTRKRKLPDLAPDPFREREELLRKLTAPFAESRGQQRIALTDEFMLKGLFPFFSAFLHAAGFDLLIFHDGDHTALKRGIQSGNVPFCAPMQLFNGVTERMAATGADLLFVPMLRSVPRADGQRFSVVCPVVQSSPDIVRWGVNHTKPAPRIISPVVNLAQGNFESEPFLESCRRMGQELGLRGHEWKGAWLAGVQLQKQFDEECGAIGRRTLEFCQAHDIVPVVVLGRAYTIYNKVLNSNVPAILREQGAIGVPVDCYPLEADTPVFTDMYWGYGQNILRAAHQVRRTPGVYSLYCSNYSCGPDSFNLHFAAYIMEGKPFAIIETDGHSGDAGTKTRVEAFLHCVDEGRRSPGMGTRLNDFTRMQFSGAQLKHLRARTGDAENTLVPYFGISSEIAAAVLRGLGLKAEPLPAPDNTALLLGRRYTSGKECLPMALTLGSLLKRIEQGGAEEKFIYLMPSANGPCRFGIYNLLNRIVFERLGLQDRVRIWSPNDAGYFDDFPPGTEMLLLAGITASDLLYQALLDTRPTERVPGATEKIFAQYKAQLCQVLEGAARSDLALAPALWEVVSGNLFGLRRLLRNAAAEFVAVRGPGEKPLIELAGEIYLRSVEYSNDFLIDKLEARGLRVWLSPKAEWLDYCGHVARRQEGRNRFADRFSHLVQKRIEATLFAALGPRLAWPKPPTTEDVLHAVRPYINDALEGEAVLTVGAPLCEWRHRHIDAVVSVGPLECMPTKIAEAQFHHVAEHEGLLSLTLSFNGDPINTEPLDNFAFEVHARFQQRKVLQPCQV